MRHCKTCESSGFGVVCLFPSKHSEEKTFTSSEILRVVESLKLKHQKYEDDTRTDIVKAYANGTQDGYNFALEDLKRELNPAPQGE